MKFMKSMALMTMGAGAVLAYQKYNKPVMNKMNEMITGMKEKMSDELENMIK